MVFGYFIYFCLIILGLVYKKNNFIMNLIALYMWFLIAFNTNSADYYVYKQMYLYAYDPIFSTHEIGYMTLCRICLKIGLSFTGFRCVVAFIIMLLTTKTVNYFAYRKNVVLSMYLIFPFLSAVSGLRQSCGNAIVIFAMRYLLENGKKNTLKYFLLIILASLFHFSCLFFMLNIIAKYTKLKVSSMSLICGCLAYGILIIAQSNFLYIIFSKITDREKTLRWLELKVNFSGLYIVAIGLLCMFLYMLYQAKIKLKIREINLIKSQKITDKQIDIFSKCVSITFLAFAGAMLNSVVFLRLILTLLPIGYAICADAFVSYKSDDIAMKNSINFYKVGMIVFCIFVTAFVYGLWIGGDTLKVPVGTSFFNGQ